MAFTITPAMQDAIECVKTSFSYDPPARTQAAWEQLKPLRDRAASLRAALDHLGFRIKVLSAFLAATIAFAFGGDYLLTLLWAYILSWGVWEALIRSLFSVIRIDEELENYRYSRSGAPETNGQD